jgi:2-C-methyl-D-erythritol 4-phosphate cytidylyltransferase
VVRGDPFNVKVTERGDLAVVEALLAAEEET